MAVVLLTGLYLAGLGAVSLFSPSRAERFLLAFAQARGAHFLELFLRAIAGVALILNGPYMRHGAAFRSFGWILVITSVVLAVIPWRLHRDFARAAVPSAVPYLRLIGLASFVMGAAVVVAAIGGRPG